MNKLILAFAAAAMLFLTAAAQAATPAQAGTVVTIQADAAPPQGFVQSNSGAVIGAALGGLAGHQATRNSNRSYVGSTVGATLGGAVGRTFDRRGRTGYSIVIRLDDGRTVAVFDRRPRVAAGERVFLIADRVIPAGGA